MAVRDQAVAVREQAVREQAVREQAVAVREQHHLLVPLLRVCLVLLFPFIGHCTATTQSLPMDGANDRAISTPLAVCKRVVQ